MYSSKKDGCDDGKGGVDVCERGDGEGYAEMCRIVNAVSSDSERISFTG